MGNALLVELAGIPPFLLPVPHFGFGVVSSSLALNNVILMVCLAAIVGAVAFAGSRVESRAARERSLHRDDPAALLAEVVRIQWKLQVQTAEVCVLVVDVSRSSEMKAGADPLKAEYSFREFQKFVEEACSASGGRIHSTAGDGAVVAFDCCAFALSAAKRLQSGLADFNAKRNRIDAPFRVRVGIHKGAVAGDLDKIMFTEVIDIAAHVQGKAPVGGIAISECVLEELPDEPVAPLKEPVDGFNVFFVLDPMGDA
jgi:class 3 adenylate cyclase